MNQSGEYDAIILGGGIAGLSMADAVLQRGKTCLLAEIKETGAGASGAPMMLINPVMGRRAKKPWEAEICYQAILNFLERVQTDTSESFYEQNGVVRPALTQKIANDFERSTTTYSWPDESWIQWIPKQPFQEFFPFFAPNYGGLLIRKGITVNGALFMKAAGEYLQKKGLQLKTAVKPQLDRADSYWQVTLAGSKPCRSKIIVDATGFRQTESPYWHFLKLHPIKGQTATFFFDDLPELRHSVSSLGYMALNKHQPGEITVGSTYEHQFNHLEPDEAGLAYLQKKLNQTLPGLLDESERHKQWASVRTSLPDKKPVTGAHPEQNGLYLIGALGSKGLLMGRYLAECLARYLYEKKEIPVPVSIRRFL